MGKKIRRYSYSYDNDTVRFDEGDYIGTKYGAVAKIKSINPETHEVTFYNHGPLDWSRISYLTDKQEYLDWAIHNTYCEGFKIGSIVSLQEEEKTIFGEIVNVRIDDVISITLKLKSGIELTKLKTELTMVSIYYNPLEKIKLITDKYCGLGQSAEFKKMNQELLNLMEGREFKMKRLNDFINE